MYTNKRWTTQENDKVRHEASYDDLTPTTISELMAMLMAGGGSSDNDDDNESEEAEEEEEMPDLDDENRTATVALDYTSRAWTEVFDFAGEAREKLVHDCRPFWLFTLTIMLTHYAHTG